MKYALLVLSVLLSFGLGGCGYVHLGTTSELAPVQIAPAINTVQANMKVINYLSVVVGAHSQDYSEEELTAMTKAIGSLESILVYSQMVNSRGEANVCRVDTIWQQAQIDYYVLVNIIKTDTWDEGNRHLFNMMMDKAKQLAYGIDQSMKDASDDSSRADMDNILSQISMWAGTAITLM